MLCIVWVIMCVGSDYGCVVDCVCVGVVCE